MRSTLRARTTLAAVVVTALAGLAACGDDADDSGESSNNSTSAAVAAQVSVSEPWARGTVGSTDPTMTAAFMLLDNPSDDDITLETVSSDVADRTELHEMVRKDGDMVMQATDGGIVIEAGKDMLLQPGGYHVMLMDLKQELEPGEEFDITLGFSDGSSITVTFPVKEFTEEEGHYHEPGTPEHTHGGDDKVINPDEPEGHEH